MKTVYLYETSSPLIEIKIDNFRYDDEDKLILSFFKENKCNYDFNCKKWTISKAYFNDFIRSSNNNPNIKLIINKEIQQIPDDEITKLFNKKLTAYPYQIEGIRFLLSQQLGMERSLWLHII